MCFISRWQWEMPEPFKTNVFCICFLIFLGKSKKTKYFLIVFQCVCLQNCPNSLKQMFFGFMSCFLIFLVFLVFRKPADGPPADAAGWSARREPGHRSASKGAEPQPTAGRPQRERRHRMSFYKQVCSVSLWSTKTTDTFLT